MRIILALLIMTLPAHAERWILSPSESVIDFIYSENDVPMVGALPDFTGWAVYDPNDAENSTVFIQVNTEAVQLPDFVRTAFARTDDWFATTAHPMALFELTSLVSNEGSMLATGILTVKGRSRPLSTTVELMADGECLRASGRLPIDLVDFDIGRGTISRLIRVGAEVTVQFDLIGRPETRIVNCG